MDLVVDCLRPIGSRQAGRFRGIRCRPQGVRAHVSDGCGLCGRPGGRHRSGAIHIACGTPGNKPPADLFGRTELAASEGSGSGDGVAGPTILRRLGLEEGHDSHSAVGGPSRDDAALVLAQRLRRSHISTVHTAREPNRMPARH
jgi:hypothetical protein